MADAESNLVPSEAADQVEVALEEQAAADDGILYLNEYQYENDLVTDFARLVASPRRRGSLYVAAAIAALIGIGMLVDNSVVVIENIYRLRSRGVPAARAAVQGAKQVGMSVIASTLTSVCVFLPVVFSSSIVRSLMLPMSLCIGYCLMASLIVAVTVVPAAASTVLKKAEPKELPWFEKVQDLSLIHI